MESKFYRKFFQGKGAVPIVVQFKTTLTASTAEILYLRLPFNCKVLQAIVQGSVAGGTPAAISLKQKKLSAGSVASMPNDLVPLTSAQMTALGLTGADLSGNCILLGGANLAAGATVMTGAVATATGNLATVDTDTTKIRTFCEMRQDDIIAVDIAAQGTGTPTVQVSVVLLPL